MSGKIIKIAALGDSMTESYGETFSEFLEILKGSYHDKEFSFFNYGVGGTRAGYGLWRLTHEYEFKSKKWPSLVSIAPDIVLLESFAYNNASDGIYGDGLKHLGEMHEEIVRTLRKQTNAHIIFVVAIAPDLDHFLEGNSNFIYTPKSILRGMAEDRARYLEEGLCIAERLKLPVANVYQACIDKESQGILRATFIGDGIHPGPAGNRLTAEVVAETIRANNII